MKMKLTLSLGDVRPADDDAKVLETFTLPDTMTVADVESMMELMELEWTVIKHRDDGNDRKIRLPHGGSADPDCTCGGERAGLDCLPTCDRMAALRPRWRD